MSREEARQQLLDEVDKKLGREKVTRIREMEEQIREEAKKESQKILSNTIHRIASDFVSENTVSVVSLPSDDMKGVSLEEREEISALLKRNRRRSDHRRYTGSRHYFQRSVRRKITALALKTDYRRSFILRALKRWLKSQEKKSTR